MTTYTRQCDGYPKKCPRSPQCGLDFDFNVADTPNDKAIREFWASNPGYSHTLIEQPAPEVEDDDWLSWRGFLVGCSIVLSLAVLIGLIP